MTLIQVTDKAKQQMQNLLAKRGGEVMGLRFGTETSGCSGMKYKVDYVTAPDANDELVEVSGLKLFIERKSLVFLIGSTIDYEDGTFSSGFVFVNPNEKSRCGCGESFKV